VYRIRHHLKSKARRTSEQNGANILGSVGGYLAGIDGGGERWRLPPKNGNSGQLDVQVVKT
jgi:hypothetical protein